MFIFSNLATSIDGKIATQSRTHFPLGTSADRDQMHILRARCDAIIMGASTIRAFKRPCKTKYKKKQPLNIVVSHSLEDFSADWPFFKDSEIQRILIVTSPLPKTRYKLFSASSQIIQIKSTRSRLALQMVKKLSALKIKRLLLEGGGELMWDFASHNLINEYHVTLTPWVIGGRQTPTLVDGVGFESHEVLPLKLKRFWRIKNELFLVYQQATSK